MAAYSVDWTAGHLVAWWAVKMVGSSAALRVEQRADNLAGGLAVQRVACLAGCLVASLAELSAA